MLIDDHYVGMNCLKNDMAYACACVCVRVCVREEGFVDDASVLNAFIVQQILVHIIILDDHHSSALSPFSFSLFKKLFVDSHFKLMLPGAHAPSVPLDTPLAAAKWL